TVLDILFHRLTTWLAPILVFTMEEVWLERFPGEESSVHLVDIPETPAAWADAALAEKWAKVRRVRRVVTSALEVQRRDKVIGSSLEAAPEVFVDEGLARILESVDFEDVCITSQIALSTEAAPAGAFKLEDTADVAVVFRKAEGEKCQRSWRILPDVGTHKHPNVCGRCDAALSELDQAAG
ncbi:MAG: class I tRNA ligase family protein, partial [Pseudomonadota bacterium]